MGSMACSKESLVHCVCVGGGGADLGTHTALHLAVRRQNSQVMRFLVECVGADVRAMTSDADERLCALHLAACAGRIGSCCGNGDDLQCRYDSG